MRDWEGTLPSYHPSDLLVMMRQVHLVWLYTPWLRLLWLYLLWLYLLPQGR